MGKSFEEHLVGICVLLKPDTNTIAPKTEEMIGVDTSYQLTFTLSFRERMDKTGQAKKKRLAQAKRRKRKNDRKSARENKHNTIATNYPEHLRRRAS